MREGGRGVDVGIFFVSNRRGILRCRTATDVPFLVGMVHR